MKKFFTLLMLCLLIALPSCNDDDNESTRNDAYLSTHLIGQWSWEYSNKDYAAGEIYTFSKAEFTRASTYENLNDKSKKSYFIEGNWSVYKGLLQLKYDVESLQTEGYGEYEIMALRDEFDKNNYLLEEQNSKGRAFGSAIDFEEVNGKQILLVDGVNGYFTRIG